MTNDYKHTIWFNDLTDQYNYFKGKVVKTFPAYSYLRKNWSIKVEADMGQARSWNYLFFTQNGKYWYYFITNIQYVNDSTVELQLELDVMQTYLLNHTLHPCFVEREHAATDEVGDNLIEEGLELGELVINSSVNMDMQELCLLVLSSYDIEQEFATEGFDGANFPDVWGSVLDDKVFSGLCVYRVDPWRVNEFTQLVDAMGAKMDGIVTLWMYPDRMVVPKKGENDHIYDIGKVTDTTTFDNTYGRPDTVDYYTPRNKKLLTYPYNFMYMTNNNGGACIYRYELFGNPERCVIRVCGSITPNASVKAYPVNYKKQVLDYDEGLVGGEYPTCAWNADIYKMWLAQNQNQQALSVLTGAAQIGVGIAATAGAFGTGGLTAPAGVGLIASGAASIAGVLAQRADMSAQTSQARGAQSCSVNVANEHQTFTVQNKSVSEERARIIDGFFDMFGYATHQVKVPNRNVRERYTYTKTIDSLVTGNICTEDLRKIQSIYDSGVTFWLDGDDIGNYTAANNCKGGA